MTGLRAEWADLPRYLAGHVELTLVALVMGIAVSLPLGIAATRHPRVEAAALATASVLQTIPGLALLAMMVPLLGFLGTTFEGFGWPAPPSIGFLPAVLALALYSVLPVLRNTVTGIAGVDPALCEAARGVGMSPREVLWQVEVPLALPTIVAGIRTATVWVVGTATLATPVGGTSLGNPIFSGLQTRNLSAVLAGSLAAAALALVLDGLIRLIEDGLRDRSRARVTIAIGVLAAVAGWAWVMTAPAKSQALASGSRPVAIGSKAFTEQYVLAEVLAGVLEGEPGITVHRVPSLGSTVAFDALVAGDLDLFVDYTGTIWATILGREGLAPSRRAVSEEVRQRLRDEYGVEVIASLGFENAYCLAMREAEAEALGIRRISDLARHAPRFEIFGDFDFFTRPEWRALESRYALGFANQRSMDSSLMYEALRAGNGHVISAYTTDGRIAAYDLRVLEDDLSVIPPYDAIVLASARLVQEAPTVVDAVRQLEGRLDARQMRDLNAEVDLRGASPASAATQWLDRCGPKAGPENAPKPGC